MKFAVTIMFALFWLQDEVPMKDKDAFMKEFDKVSETTSSIQCKFVQQKFVSFSKEPLRSEGMLYFQDQKMRWEQIVPKDYLMVIDGEVLKIKEDGKIEEHGLEANKYMRGLKEIMVGSMTGNLLKSDQFETELLEDAQHFIVKLTPRPKRLKKMFSKVKMNFDRESYRMKKVILSEPEGDYTVITFEDAVFNKQLNPNLFKL